MLILTGGAGFIGTNMLMKLNQIGEDNILIVDDINTSMKWKNLVVKKFRDYLHKDDLWEWLKTNPQTRIDSVIHLGA
ncbi:TPA: NAD-dependent epimerase/dehydratase family protein, partial [Candidatus Poribacteria bacterium]|nr:NAD-dependent epimerase/dehydratase family protein [Candidatus Poribacteria bacterium]